MSTKTTIKRIALVAVASLGFGLLSVVPSNAAGTASLTAVTTTVTTGAQTTTSPIPQGTAITTDLLIDPNASSGAAFTAVVTWSLFDPAGNNVSSSVNFVNTGTLGAKITTSTFAANVNTIAVAVTSGTDPLRVGSASWTPTMGGTYSWKYSYAAVAVVTADTQDALALKAIVAVDVTPDFYVSGATVTQGTTRGGPVGAAAVGNQAAVTVTFPTHTGSEVYRVVSTGVGAIVGAADTTGASTPISGVAANWSQGLTYTNAANTTLAKVVLNLASTAGGVQTLTVTSVSPTTGLNTSLYSINVTWGALSTLLPAGTILRHGPVATVGNAQLDTAATATAYNTTVDAIPLSAVSTVSTNVATVQVLLVNNDATAAIGGHTITATVSGSGFVLANTTSTVGTGNARSSSVTLTAGSQNIAWVHVSADGTSGTGIITFSVTDAVSGGTTVIGTETFTFYGSVATLAVAASNYTIGRAGYTTGAASATQSLVGIYANPLDSTVADRKSAFVIVAKDSIGNAVTTGTVPTVVSSDANVVTGGTCVLDAGSALYGSSTNGVGFYNCNFTSAPNAVSGATATLTVRVADPASSTGGYITTTVAVKIGGGQFKETLSFDKTTYTPGEAMVVTRTAVDSAGNTVADGSAAPAVVFNKYVGGTAPIAGFYVGGQNATSATAPTVFAPVSSGIFEGRMSGYNSSATTTSAIIATSSVSADGAETASSAAADAAAEATDAANAATDAANAAAEAADAATAAAQDAADAVAALSTQVSEMVNALKKQITALTNLVIKIQKKVKA